MGHSSGLKKFQIMHQLGQRWGGSSSSAQYTKVSVILGPRTQIFYEMTILIHGPNIWTEGNEQVTAVYAKEQ